MASSPCRSPRACISRTASTGQGICFRSSPWPSSQSIRSHQSPGSWLQLGGAKGSSLHLDRVARCFACRSKRASPRSHEGQSASQLPRLPLRSKLPSLLQGRLCSSEFTFSLSVVLFFGCFFASSSSTFFSVAFSASRKLFIRVGAKPD